MARLRNEFVAVKVVVIVVIVVRKSKLLAKTHLTQC